MRRCGCGGEEPAPEGRGVGAAVAERSLLEAEGRCSCRVLGGSFSVWEGAVATASEVANVARLGGVSRRRPEAPRRARSPYEKGCERAERGVRRPKIGVMHGLSAGTRCENTYPMPNLRGKRGERRHSNGSH
ncbi:MAG: hypothetical protein ACXQTZ_00845 [Candidatus Alkanophagales archaeon]